MSIVIWISSIVLLIGCGFCMYGYLQGEDGFIGLGFICVFLSGILGFGIIGNAHNVKTKVLPIISYEYYKFSDRISILVDDRLYTYKDAFLYSHLNDASELGMKVGLNSYNHIIKREIVIVGEKDAY